MLDSLTDLPSLPQVLVGISRVASNDLSRADHLSDMILRDQALTMRLLKIANSAQYSMYSQRITTVSKAVLILGFDSVRAITMGAEMYRLLSSLTKAGEILERFWKDAVSVAVTSQGLAELMGLENIEEAFVAGLLHDVGKLIFAQCEPEKARRVYLIGLSGQPMLEEETRVFGVNHAEIGSELARRWGLPSEIRIAMESHHGLFSRPPATRGEMLAFIVSVAKTLVAPLTLSNDERCRELSSKMARVLRIPVGKVLATLRELPDKIREYAEFFDIHVDDLKVYTMWVEEENQRLVSAIDPAVEQQRRQKERQQSLLDAVRNLQTLILSGTEKDIVAKNIAEAARRTIGAERILLLSLDVQGEAVRNAWYSGDVDMPFVARFKSHLFRSSILSQAVAGGAAVNVMDSRLPYFQRLMSRQDAALLDSPVFAAVPILFGGLTVGLVYADRDKEDDPFGDEDLAGLEMLANLMGIAYMA